MSYFQFVFQPKNHLLYLSFDVNYSKTIPPSNLELISKEADSL